MTAVIYARYSSDNQREESIEGQIRECTDYAEKNGVHLISVMEPIAEGSQGILVETLLEGMAEYYSAELSEKVIRGQTENALKGKCTGGTGTIGYKIDEDKFYHLDPLTSPLVLEAFQRYDNGDKMVEIVNFLNDKGVRNMLGGKMTHSSVNTMLKNRRYIANCLSGISLCRMQFRLLFRKTCLTGCRSVWIRTSVPLPVARQMRNIC